jgi:6,7-dimethyl-8-ribityllumazine synthase
MNPPATQFQLQPFKRLAFVQAGWHQDIVEQSQLSFLQHMKDAGMKEDEFDLVDVPGSLEIPLQCQSLARSGKYQVIVAAGFIVDGGIYRHDFVSATVLDAMMQVQLQTEIPILSIVLTPHNFDGLEEHQLFFRNHFKVKGKEAAQACLQVLANQEQGYTGTSL